MTASNSSASECFELSQEQCYRALAKIENLTYRIGYLSSFVSAAEETSQLLTGSIRLLIYFSHEVNNLNTSRQFMQLISYSWWHWLR